MKTLVLLLTILVSFAKFSVADDNVGFQFNRNLTLGSKGADVARLQQFLESKGFLKLPAGVVKGYFGGLTKMAVAAYQVSKRISPSGGFFGPITRSAVQADLKQPATEEAKPPKKEQPENGGKRKRGRLISGFDYIALLRCPGEFVFYYLI